MASNARGGLRGSPSFLIVGLSLVIVVLLYSYWSVSSRNSMLLRDQSILQNRLRSLTSQKIAAEKKKSSVMAQVVDMEKTKRTLEGNVMSSSKEKTELNKKVHALEGILENEKKKMAMLQNDESKNKAELEKLKSNIEVSAEKLKTLNGKVNSLVEKYSKLNVQLAAKNDELFKTQNNWEVCKVKLAKLKEERPDSGGDLGASKRTLKFNKGKGDHEFKKGLERLKQLKNPPVTIPPTVSQTKVKPGQKLQVPTKPVKNNSTVTPNPTGQVTTGSGTQSGNKTSETVDGNQPIITTKASGSTNTTNVDAETQQVNKESNPKPTEHPNDVESDDPHEHDEDENNNLVPARARPLGINLERRQEDRL